MRCLIVEDHPLSLAGLNWLVGTNFPEWEIILTRTFEEAIECVRGSPGEPIGLALMSLMPQSKSVSNLLKYFRESSLMQDIRSMVISDSDDLGAMGVYRELGAKGFVSKNGNIADIVYAIRAVALGGEFFPNDTRPCMLVAGKIRVTNRQRDLIDLVLAGYSNKEIAATLGLSYGTVKNYMFNLMRMLAVVSRLELALKIKESGYLPRRTVALRHIGERNKPGAILGSHF